MTQARPGRNNLRVRASVSEPESFLASRTPWGGLAVRDSYHWSGATLVLVSHSRTTIRGTPADPALARYSAVSCGGLSAARGEF